MNQFTQTFNTHPVILPVIHVESRDQALRNAEIARDTNCDGIFLINHNMPYTELLDIHHTLYRAFPDWWLGVNCLDLAAEKVFDKLTDEVAGLWVDNAGIDEQADEQAVAERIAEARQKSGWSGLYFGGVAFKYQRAVADLTRAAKVASKYMDVVTTSGPGTGQAAHASKIQTMKEAIAPFPLAIASGVSPENIDQYLGLCDCFLVATSISRSWTELDPARVKQLVARVRESQDRAQTFPNES